MYVVVWQLCCLVVCVCLQLAEGNWVSLPQNLKLCVGSDAEFRWHFEENTPVDMIFWMYMGTGKTMMAWYNETNSTKVYPDFAGRVERLPGTNAGVILRGVGESDSGDYKIEVAGPGWRDTRKMNVYAESKLKPVVLVDNVEIGDEAVLNKNKTKQTTITVNTREDLLANITITTQDTVLTSCIQKSLCSAVISFHDFTESNLTTSVKVDYGVCNPQQLTFYVIAAIATSSSSVLIVILVLIIIIIIIILAVSIGIWFYLRRRYLDKKPLKPWQKRYMRCICWYKLFTKLKRWRSVSGGGVTNNRDENIQRELAVNPNYYGENKSKNTTEAGEDVPLHSDEKAVRYQNKSFLDKIKDFFSIKPKSSPADDKEDSEDKSISDISDCVVISDKNVSEIAVATSKDSPNAGSSKSNDQSTETASPGDGGSSVPKSSEDQKHLAATSSSNKAKEKNVSSKSDVAAPVQGTTIDDETKKARKKEAKDIEQRAKNKKVSDKREEHAGLSQPPVGGVSDSSQSQLVQPYTEDSPINTALPEDDSEKESCTDTNVGAFKDPKINNTVDAYGYGV